jgi:hypothetical protein
VIASAAANIAFKLLTDGAVFEVVAFAADYIDRGHDHARRAEAALQAVIFAESLLHRVEWPVRGRQSLDRQHVGALELQREDGARFDRFAVDMHDTCAALRRVAADMRASEPQMFAQQLYEQRARIDIGGDGLAVHRHGHGCRLACHWVPPRKFRSKRRDLPTGRGRRRGSGANSRRFCRF